MFSLCQGKGSVEAFQCGQSTEKGQGRNGEEGTSREDKATDGLGVERAGVGEVGEGGRVGRPGPEGCRCAREDGRNEVKDFRGQFNLLVRVQRRGNGDSGEDGQRKTEEIKLRWSGG